MMQTKPKIKTVELKEKIMEILHNGQLGYYQTKKLGEKMDFGYSTQADEIIALFKEATP